MAIVTSPAVSVRATSNPPSWQQALKNAVRDPLQLCQQLGLPASCQAGAVQASRSFPVFAPLEFIRRMVPGNPHDPLLRQVLPLGEELESAASYTTDPLGEEAAKLQPGLLQKYHGRALLITTGACAVHCRYCFRRHYPYSESPPGSQVWQPALDRIAADDRIEEVLLSGGDPLTLTDALLGELAQRLAAIPHVQRLRIHTRLPIMIPQRVSEPFLDWLTGTRLTPLVVVHANHPAELDEAVAGSLARLLDAGVPVLNQAVLLRQVNDDLPALEQLCRRLADLRVMPYYLHQLDRVAGAAHFEVPIQRGLELLSQLRARLPGYAVPRYVQEVPGDSHKRVLA